MFELVTNISCLKGIKTETSALSVTEIDSMNQLFVLYLLLLDVTATKKKEKSHICEHLLAFIDELEKQILKNY